MNETRGNARTKPKSFDKIKTIEDYRQYLKYLYSLEENKREPLKEREINSLKDTEKTNDLKIKGCLLHKSDLWKTPSKIYHHFVIKRNFFDPCPTNPTFDGLTIEWKKLNFVNPPYSQISKWIDKALEELSKNKSSIFLIPARTDTKWFRKIIESGGEIIFIQGRLHFNDKGPAPFPSMFVIFSFSTCKLSNPFSYINKEDFIKQFK